MVSQLSVLLHFPTLIVWVSTKEWVNLCLWGTKHMIGHVTQKQWLVTSCTDEMKARECVLWLCSRPGWAPCCHVKQHCCLLLLQILFSPLLIPLLLLLFSLSSEQWWCVVYFRAFWTFWESLRTRWGSGSWGFWGLEIHWLWKYKSISLLLFELQSIRLQFDTSKMVNHCRRAGALKPTQSTIKQHFWQDESLNLHFTLPDTWTVQCTKCTNTSSQQIIHHLCSFSESKASRQNIMFDDFTFCATVF